MSLANTYITPQYQNTASAQRMGGTRITYPVVPNQPYQQPSSFDANNWPGRFRMLGAVSVVGLESLLGCK